LKKTNKFVKINDKITVKYNQIIYTFFKSSQSVSKKFNTGSNKTFVINRTNNLLGFLFRKFLFFIRIIFKLLIEPN